MNAVVLVTYNPFLDLLEKCIDSLVDQVDSIIVVDNSSTISIDLISKKYRIVNVYHESENLGIAAAQNIGIRYAIRQGAKYILFSDQDTCYPSNYFDSMIQVFKDNKKVCAAVPRFLDSNKKTMDGLYDINGKFFGFFYPEYGFHDVFQAISSGMIVEADCLSEIGLMNEYLFIDWVDFEWCWRARKKGYRLVANANMIINHQLGDGSKNLGFREVNLRSPMRHYYITRNAFYLALYSNDLDVWHRITLFFKSFRYIIGYPALSKPHLKHLRAVLLGFYHGVTQRLGKYDL